MRSILLHIHDDDSLESRLQVALDLAREFDGHVTCLQAVPHEVVVPGDYYGAIVDDMMPVLKEQADALRAKLEARLAAEDVRWDWVEEIGLVDSRLMQYAALSDVVVLGGAAEGLGDGAVRLAGELVIHARVPIMIVPEGHKGIDVDAPVLVAWNGSPEASRAVRAALPMLARASMVTLATVAEKAGKARLDLPPLRAAEFLSRHGIASEIVELPASDAGAAQVLAEAARARGCSCMVMGAYGHSRLLESVFGGVTHKMLKAPALPILLAH